MTFKEHTAMYKACHWYLKYISISVYGLTKHSRIANTRNIHVHVLSEQHNILVIEHSVKENERHEIFLWDN